MPVTDAYQVLMDLGNFTSGAQKVAGGLTLIQGKFQELENVTTKYNSKGKLVGQTFTGIATSGEKLSLSLEKIAKGWQLVGAKSTAGVAEALKAQVALDAANQRAAIRRETRGQQVGQAAVGIVSAKTLPANGSASELLSYNKALAGLQKFTQENVTSAARVQKVWADVNNNVFSSNPKYQALQNQLVRVKNAITDIGKESERAKHASDNYFLSWRNIMRFFEARLLYNAISDLSGAVRSGIDRAIEFEQVLGRITTLAPTLAGGYKEWGESVKRVAKTFGVDATDAAKSYYSALSNQIGNSIVEVEAFTRTTAEFARVTGSTAEQANNLFSSAINAFGKTASDATDIAAKFFKTIDLGRVTAAGLSGSFGRTAVAAATLGVKYEELLASLSTLSRQGVTDADAQTQTLNLFNKLIKPTEKLKELIREWGYESGQSIIANEGLIGVLGRLDKELQEGGVARLGELVNDIRGLRGTFGLTGKGLKEFSRDLDLISNSQADYTRAIDLTSQTLGYKLAKELNSVKVAFTNLGQSALEGIVPISESIGGLVNGIKVVIGTVITFGTAIYGLRIVISVINGIKNAWIAVGVAAKTAGAASATAGALATGGISLAVGAIASYLLLAESKIETYQRAYGEALDAMDAATTRSIEATTKSYDNIAKSISNSFKPVYDALRDVRASFSATVISIDKDFAEYKDNVRELSTSVFRSLDESISKVTSRISDLKAESKSLHDEVNKSFRTEAIDDFRDQLDGLSSGKKAKAIESEIKIAAAKAKALALDAERSTDNDIAAKLSEQSAQQVKLAVALVSDFKTAAKAAIKEKSDAQKELAKLSKKDTEAAQKELDLRREIATASNELAANRKRPGSKDDANNRQELAASRLSRAQEALNEHLKKTAEAKKALQVLERDAQGIDVNKQLFNLHTGISDALLAQEATTNRILAAEEARKQNLEDQKAPLKEVFDDALELLGSEDSKATSEQIQTKIRNLVSEFKVASKNISTITGEAIDYGALTALLSITDKIERRSKAQTGEKETDKTLAKARAEEVEALRQVNDLKAKTNSLDLARKDAVAQLVGQIEKLGTVNVLNFRGVSLSGDIVKLAKEYNTLSTRLQEIKEGLKVDPNNIQQYSVELQQIAVDFAKIQAGKGDVMLKSAGQIGIEEFKGALGAALNYDFRLQQTKVDTTELINLQAQLGTAIVAAANGGAAAQSSLNAQLRESIASLKELQALSGTLAPTPATNKAGGGLMHFAGGGRPYGSDKIPSLLSPGEFVVNAGASRRFYSQLVAMNSGSRNYAGGGNVNTSVGDVNISMASSGNAHTDVVRIGKLLRREIRRGTVKL